MANERKNKEIAESLIEYYNYLKLCNLTNTKKDLEGLRELSKYIPKERYNLEKVDDLLRLIFLLSNPLR
ncbi:hypothetical protein SJAV_26580 [Sulfurisphaera javensis]|uniref:Uncharacterized protein n=1 Tax=Sulfurisphaera javensis TaxID=2049879 RepID=A0AAT9GV07_9CREN